LQGLGFVEEAVVLAETLLRSQAQIFFQQREIDAKKLGALNRRETVIGAPEALELGGSGSMGFVYPPIWAR
jgi:hypothetical protein